MTLIIKNCSTKEQRQAALDLAEDLIISGLYEKSLTIDTCIYRAIFSYKDSPNYIIFIQRFPQKA